MGHPLTLVGFLEMHPTLDACRRTLLEQRWWERFRCPRCTHAVAWYLRGRGLCECAGCGGQASLTAGALLHKTRTDLRKWLLAIWLLRRKITHAMRRGEHELLLRGAVELDESLVGGRERGRASQRKTLVAVAAEQTPQDGLGRAHLRVIDDAGAKTLTKAARAQTGLPEIRGTRSAQKVVASRERGRLRRDGSCYYREPGPAAVSAGVAVTRKSLNAGGSGSSKAEKIWR